MIHRPFTQDIGEIDLGVIDVVWYEEVNFL